jgi:uncharacterized integral membrane protein (TIGR00698 family)
VATLLKLIKSKLNGNQFQISKVREFSAGVIFFITFIAIALLISNHFSFISPLFLSLLFGLVLGQSFSSESFLGRNRIFGPKWEMIRSYLAKRIMRLGIVFLGFQISFRKVAQIGWIGFCGILVVVAVVFLSVRFLAPYFGVEPELATLLASGFSICGVSAISAVGAVRKSEKVAIAYASGVVTGLGTLSIFTLPPIAHFLSLNTKVTGSWIGAAVHDVGQVVATASFAGHNSLRYAIVTKLTRVVLITPLLLILGRSKVGAGDKNFTKRVKESFPLFVVAFLLIVILNNEVNFPANVLNVFNWISKVSLSAGLFSMALGVKWQEIKSVGHKPIIFGLLAWIVLGAFSLGIVSLFS